MRAKTRSRIGILFLVACICALSLGVPAFAGRCPSPCTPSTAVYHSEFYGYYRTCWRRWPGGQPPCPVAAAPVQAEEKAPRLGPNQGIIEMLPAPTIEEPERK